MTLKSSVDVKVIVDFNHKIKETEAGEKNNEKAAKLTPECQSVKMVEIKTKGLAGEEAKTQKSDIPLQKNPWQIVAPLFTRQWHEIRYRTH